MIGQHGSGEGRPPPCLSACHQCHQLLLGAEAGVGEQDDPAGLEDSNGGLCKSAPHWHPSLLGKGWMRGIPPPIGQVGGAASGTTLPTLWPQPSESVPLGCPGFCPRCHSLLCSPDPHSTGAAGNSLLQDPRMVVTLPGGCQPQGPDCLLFPEISCSNC